MRRQILIGFSFVAVSVSWLAVGTGVAAADPAGCDASQQSQPFAPWGDPSSYELLPNGGFEQGGSSWTLTDAQVVAGNESFYANSGDDTSSLSLGDAGSATSDPVCVSAQDPTLRLFVENDGSPLSLLQVSVQFTGPLGDTTIPVGLIAAGSGWQPSAPTPVVVNLVSLLNGNATDASFQFTPIGPGGDWTIDDVYLDPFKTK